MSHDGGALGLEGHGDGCNPRWGPLAMMVYFCRLGMVRGFMADIHGELQLDGVIQLLTRFINNQHADV